MRGRVGTLGSSRLIEVHSIEEVDGTADNRER